MIVEDGQSDNGMFNKLFQYITGANSENVTAINHYYRNQLSHRLPIYLIIMVCFLRGKMTKNNLQESKNIFQALIETYAYIGKVAKLQPKSTV